MEPKRTNHCITIMIVGSLMLPLDASEQMRAFQETIAQELYKQFPDFRPARPPVTVSWMELRDDWIKQKD